MSPHDAPTAQQLVEAVREWIEQDVLAETSGRLHYHARVAINVLAMVEREIALGAGQDHEHAERLQRLGFGSDEELAAAIRSSELELTAELRDEVWASVRAKLAVANPKYLEAKYLDAEQLDVESSRE